MKILPPIKGKEEFDDYTGTRLAISVITDGDDSDDIVIPYIGVTITKPDGRSVEYDLDEDDARELAATLISLADRIKP